MLGDFFSNYCFILVTILSLLALVVLSRRWPAKDLEQRVILRWLFTVFLISLFFFCLEYFPYFDDSNYFYFRRYILDPLYLYFLFGNYFFLRYLSRPDEDEKYWKLIRFIFYRESWSSEARIAVLSLLVKAFYLPMLCSWTVNNIIHQQNLINDFTWSFLKVQEFLVAWLILVDVGIFMLGYLLEWSKLGNTIKSVDPTFLGWFVCIACYPPLNDYTFVLFDVALNPGWRPPGELVNAAALVATVVLWAIYTWASVALGFRASNLTNRGIVDWGPYAYVRHPAYISKMLIWVIAGAFLGEKNIGLLLALAFIYYMRLWTEERHLLMDEDYREYCKKVRWKIIPGLY